MSCKLFYVMASRTGLEDNEIEAQDIYNGNWNRGSCYTQKNLGHIVYRKSTHTDRYLYKNSNHHPSQKQGIIKTLVKRARRICVPGNFATKIHQIKEIHKSKVRKEKRQWPRPFYHIYQGFRTGSGYYLQNIKWRLSIHQQESSKTISDR